MWTLSFALAIQYPIREEQFMVLEKHTPRTSTSPPSSKTVVVFVKDFVIVERAVAVTVLVEISVTVCKTGFVVVWKTVLMIVAVNVKLFVTVPVST